MAGGRPQVPQPERSSHALGKSNAFLSYAVLDSETIELGALARKRLMEENNAIGKCNNMMRKANHCLATPTRHVHGASASKAISGYVIPDLGDEPATYIFSDSVRNCNAQQATQCGD